MMFLKASEAVFRVSVMALLLLAVVPWVLAQSDTSVISGFARDSTGAMIPNAGVTILNTTTGLERKLSTDASGYYAAPNLPSGVYTVTFEARGFKRTVVTGSKLDPNTPLQVSGTLTVGETHQSVEVAAQANEVQTDTAAVGRIVTEDQIKNLQLNGRNPALFAQLLPGVTRSTSISSFTFGLESQFNINGARVTESMMTIDGAPAIRTRAATFPVGVADLDSTQEVQVLTANYRAEYGRSNGGQIRIITKSGTKDFHASAYEYFRNSALDANSWVRKASGNPAIGSSAAAFRFNQFGFNASGPVIFPGTNFNKDRNKLFWLYSQEWTRFRQDQTATRRVPTNLMRTGDFSELLSPTNVFYGRTVTVKDPTGGAPFANNVIPNSRLSPNGTGILKQFTSPTPGFSQGGQNLFMNLANPQNQGKQTASADFLPADKHYIRFRYLRHTLDQYAAFRGNYDRGRRWLLWENQVTSINHTWTISPTLVNEVVASVTLDRVDNVLDRNHPTWLRSNYGITFPYIFPDRKARPEMIPEVNITGLTGLSTNQEGRTSGPIYAVSDNLSKVWGRHVLKAGIYFERAGQNENGGAIENGTFNFTDLRAGAPTSGVAMANAALGLFDTYSELGPYNYAPFRGMLLEYYLQDSWKVTNKLQLEFGLRHSLIQPYYSMWNNLSFFDARYYNPANAAVVDPKTGVILKGDPLNGMVIPGDGFPDSAIGRIGVDPNSPTVKALFKGLNRAYGEFYKTDIQPRVGLAYAVTQKDVVRAAGGRYVLRPSISDAFNPGANPPFLPSAYLVNGNVDNPSSGSSLTYPSNPRTQEFASPNPNSWLWNATYERSLPGSTLLTVGYVGRKGLHLPNRRNLNQLPPGTVQANPGVNQNSLRPYSGYGPILSTSNTASSTYNAFQMMATRRYSKGLLYGASYTYGKSMDNSSSNGETLPNAQDARTYWGPSTFDVRHVLVVNFAYDLPFFRNSQGLTRTTLGGWQISGISQFQTGMPFTVLTGNDFAGVGSGGGSQIWNVTGDPNLPRSDRAFASSVSEANYWFKPTNSDGTAMFTAPAAGTFAKQLNRNLLYAPGYQNWNISLLKVFQLAEHHALRFRMEVFNWVNHPNWGGPGTDPMNLSTLGKVTSKNSERNLQLSLRYSF